MNINIEGKTPELPSNRLYNLDYLRGIAAFGIMIFHLLSWSYGYFTSESFFGRVGVYGVSVFYVLSGLTLFYVYYDKMEFNKADIVSFFKKRIFRIYPLLWLVILLSLILTFRFPEPQKLFLNLTGLFGFVSWDQYYSTGLWSIGNELVFYAFFPVFILLLKNSKTMMVILSLLLLGIFLFFSFNILNTGKTLSAQWRNYVNPLNQVFLFLGGFLIGYFFKFVLIKNYQVILLLITALAVFVFFPVHGERVNLVVGIPRMVFTACCFAICLAFFKLRLKFPDFLHQPLTMLGEASYSVYLLHPLVWKIFYLFSKGMLKYFSIQIPQWILIIGAGVISLIVSYYIYQKFEKYFIKLGRKPWLRSSSAAKPA